MIPFDKAVEMLRSLSQTDYEAAANYIAALATNHRNPDQPLNRAQLLEDLTISRHQETDGKHKSASDAFDEVMAEYGLIRR